MTCVLKLIKLLDQYGISNDYSTPITDPWNVPRSAHETLDKLNSRSANLILLGNIRSHPAIRTVQGNPFYTKEWRWNIASKSVEPVKPDDTPSYVDHEVIDGEARLVYAVLSRMPSTRADRVVTVIAGNNGRAYEGLAELLTSDHHLGDLFQKHLKWPDDKPLPDRFQIVFSVRISKSDQRLEDAATFVAALPQKWPVLTTSD